MLIYKDGVRRSEDTKNNENGKGFCTKEKKKSKSCVDNFDTAFKM